MDKPSRKKPENTENLDDLRERLYARGTNRKESERHSLREDKKPQVKTSWSETPEQIHQPIEQPDGNTREVKKMKPRVQSSLRPAQTENSNQSFTPSVMQTPTRRNGFRKKILIIGFSFFVIALILSSLFLFFGNNSISGDNIQIEVSGPFSVGGGEEMPIQVTIANQNTVSIESATLIVEYPNGTQSAAEPGKELFSERQQLSVIESGEVVNVPIRAIMFGEENDEKIVNISVEYRVRGSNATFFKGAEPLRFKISSSPVVLSVASIKSITSGQEADIVLTVSSNSPSPLTDILVKAEYPFGFDFTNASPQTDSGQDTWFIETLDPEEEYEITIKGIVVGKQDEERVFDFSVGVPNERDRFNLASIFNNASTEIKIEQPFLEVDVMINDSRNETVVISTNDSAQVRIDFRNTLDDTLYDTVVEAELSGNALSEIDVNVTGGFYDSNENIIRWSSADMSALEQIAPGQTESVFFTFDPNQDTSRTPEVLLDVTVKGKRIFEDQVPQELAGTAYRVIKVESVTTLSSSGLYSEGPFTNTGPIPPVAEEVTEYTLSFKVQNGSNDITGAEMTASLPGYITWLNNITSGDEVSYDPTTRIMRWDIGNMNANQNDDMSVQVSFLPSLSQVETSPTLIGVQRFKATDRFTGTVLRADSPAISTELFDDPDKDTHNGRVREEE